MANIIAVALDALRTGGEVSKDLNEIQNNLPADFEPLAKDLLKFLADFKIQEPWLTDTILVEGLQALSVFLESKKPV